MKKILMTCLLFLLIPVYAWAGYGYNIINTGSVPVTGGQFDDWGRKCALVIQYTQVTDNESNYPLLVAKVSLPDEIFDADGSYPALNGGGDIRFTSDSAGNSRLSCDIEQFVTDNDPTNGKCAIHIKVPSVSSTVNTTIYIWYNEAGQSQPAVDAAYGAESVWISSYEMVQHLNEDPSGSSPQALDSTSNDNDGTSAGTMLTEDLVAGQIGTCLDFDKVDDCIVVPHNASIDFADEDFGFSFWFKTSSVLQNNYIFSKNYGTDTIKWYGTNMYITEAILKSFLDDGTTNNAVAATDDYNDDVFHLYHLTRNTTTNKITAYIDGQQNAQIDDTTGSLSNTGDFVIGSRADFGSIQFFSGLIDEFRVFSGVRSAGLIETEYNNQKTPGTFLIEGTPESP